MGEMSAAARYTPVAVAPHWIIAVAIIYQLVAGMVMEHLPVPVLRIRLVQMHSSLGMLVLPLIRRVWRGGSGIGRRLMIGA